MIAPHNLNTHVCLAIDNEALCIISEGVLYNGRVWCGDCIFDQLPSAEQLSVSEFNIHFQYSL